MANPRPQFAAPPRLKMIPRLGSDKIDLIQIFDVLCARCSKIAGHVENDVNVFTGYPKTVPPQLCRSCREEKKE